MRSCLNKTGPLLCFLMMIAINGYSHDKTNNSTEKLKTIVHRVARLIEDGEAPESILLLTFTKKAE